MSPRSLFDWKVCKTCGVELPTTEFSLTNVRPGALRGSCKPCERDKLKRTDAYNKCSCGQTKKAESLLCIRCDDLRNTYQEDFLKVCTKCGVEKKAIEFGWRMHKKIKRIRNLCKACGNEATKQHRQKTGKAEMNLRKRRSLEKMYARREKDADYRLRHRRTAIRSTCRALGIKGDHAAIANAYTLESECAICREQSDGRLHLDHCHATGRFRGFLCSGCNTGIGQLKESYEIFMAAIRYLGIGPVCAGLE